MYPIDNPLHSHWSWLNHPLFVGWYVSSKIFFCETTSRMDVVGHLELLAACMDSGQMDLAPVILEGMMKEVSSLFVEDVEVRFSPDCSFSYFFFDSVCLRLFACVSGIWEVNLASFWCLNFMNPVIQLLRVSASCYLLWYTVLCQSKGTLIHMWIYKLYT